MELVTIISEWFVIIALLLSGGYLFLIARLSYVTNQTEIKNLVDGCIPDAIKVEIRKRQRALNMARRVIVFSLLLSITGLSMGVGVVILS